MLEVHLPHKTIEGLKEFSVHIVTITIGLLIAVGIERFVEWRHHLHIADEARQTMRLEIEENVKSIDKALVKIETYQRTMQANLDVLAKIQQSGNRVDSGSGDLDAHFSVIGLDNTSWQTARATGAFSYMPYDEAQTLNSIYEAQATFETAQRLIVEDVAQLVGLIHRFNLTHNGLKPTAEQASAIAERFGIWQAHLLMVHTTARLVAEQQHAFLEGRKPNTSMNEELQFEREVKPAPAKE